MPWKALARRTRRESRRAWARMSPIPTGIRCNTHLLRGPAALPLPPTWWLLSPPREKIFLPVARTGRASHASDRLCRQRFAPNAPHPDPNATASAPHAMRQCKPKDPQSTRGWPCTDQDDCFPPCATCSHSAACCWGLPHTPAAPARPRWPRAAPGQPGHRRRISRQRAGRRGAGAPAIPQYRQLAGRRLPAAATQRRGGVFDGAGHRRAPHRGRDQAQGGGAESVRAGPRQRPEGGPGRGGQRQPVPYRGHPCGAGRGGDHRASLLAANRLPRRRVLAALPAHLYPALPHARGRAARRRRHPDSAGLC